MRLANTQELRDQVFKKLRKMNLTLHSSAERSCLGLLRLSRLGSETQLESHQEVNHLLCKPDDLSSTLRRQSGERCGEERIKQAEAKVAL